MKELRHQRIIANAGSGKTHRLVTRYLDLLSRGVAPERIVALTFTRKAAGEFLDRIFERLLQNVPEEGPARLRQMIEKLPRLMLGTLDSFFGKIVRAFPFECGLAGDIAILDDHALAVARRQVLDRVFREQAAGPDEVFAEFLDLIRRQNRNSESRDVTNTLMQEIEGLQERFLMTPAGRPWGDAAAIWPDGCAILHAADPSGPVQAFEQELFAHHGGMEEKYRAHWEERLAEIRALRPGFPVPEKPLLFALRALKSAVEGDGEFPLKVHGNKIFRFPDAARGLVVSLARAIVKIELEGHLVRSRALYDLVERFEKPYQRQVRDAGQLTFTDITGLLADPEGSETLHGLTRENIDFRLDASYDHWLLDEFQDTSRLQWMAIRNLVDEVVQSDSGQRSFFYVGDTKQAIYTWRGGDPRLFDEVADFYNAADPRRIDLSEALDISWRSVPEILDAVNAVFAPANLGKTTAALELPEETVRRWESAWREHKPHDRSPGRGAFVWRTVEIEDGEKNARLDEAAARLIAEIRPLDKGLSCAVLVNTNARVAAVIEALRAAGLEARSEGRYYPCRDNELGTALLSLFRAVAHPADRLSLEHAGMTPWRNVTGENFAAFRLEALRKIRSEGFEGAVAAWVEKLALQSEFARSRARSFLRAAADFDALPGVCGTIDEFVQFAESYAASDDPADGAVRVLTVHGAKGLDFDVVVLPDLESVTLASRRRDAPVYLHEGREDRRVDWGLELPPVEICRADEVLGEAAAAVLADDCYQNLCLYYVAMTRAKRGLYLLGSRRKETSNARDFARLLRETFSSGEDIVRGDPDWPGRSVASPRNEAMRMPEAFPPSAHFRGLPGSPSRDPSSRRAVLIFGEGREVGTEVHADLAQISWIDEAKLPPFHPLVEAFLKMETARRIFTRPSGACVLWREQPFDVLVDGRWISGAFDRVAIRQEADGRPAAAAIYDFKTDQGPLPKSYRKQMELYRKSLGVLLALPEAQIAARLVAVRTGEEIRLFD